LRRRIEIANRLIRKFEFSERPEKNSCWRHSEKTYAGLSKLYRTRETKNQK
jgi:hypothetical protein